MAFLDTALNQWCNGDLILFFILQILYCDISLLRVASFRLVNFSKPQTPNSVALATSPPLSQPTDRKLILGDEMSLVGAIWLHGLCGLSLATAFSVARHFFSVDLVSDPDSTLFLLSVIQCPVIIFLYSLHRENCSYLKAVGRGLLGLIVGAVVVAFVAISLGAPVGTKYLKRTVYWSLLMSLLTFAPVAAIFGSSWEDWQRIFANTRPAGPVDFMVCLPAHGAILGAWFGAWPMPLDWERPWQEWPICVTYGAVVGYTIGMIASVIFVAASKRKQHIKKE